MYGHNPPVGWIQSYAEARATHDAIEPLRGQPEQAPRPLGRRASANPYKVHMCDDAVIFSHHGTDLVTWFPDGGVEVVPWGSVSSAQYIDRLLPVGVSMSFHRSVNTYSLRVEGRHRWLAGTTVTILPVPHGGRSYRLKRGKNPCQPDGTRPIPDRRVDRHGFNTAWKWTGGAAFERWVRALAALNPSALDWESETQVVDDIGVLTGDDSDKRHARVNARWVVLEILRGHRGPGLAALLADRTRWLALARAARLGSMGSGSDSVDASKMLNRVRLHLRAAYPVECYQVGHLPACDSAERLVTLLKRSEGPL